ncbi:MAG: ferritin [Planctomycetales bacterium]|nr:MAG: ferritin [Planctomycetales bacterium]
MLSASLEQALNDQLHLEFESSYVYLSMSAWFEWKNMLGFAKWMNIQRDEEQFHASKFYHFILDRGGQVKLKSLAQPKWEWGNPIEVFEAALEHEMLVTRSIHALVDQAMAEKDHPGFTFLQWFVSEQVEEEATITAIIDQLKLVKDSQSGMFLMDKELGARTVAHPMP